MAVLSCLAARLGALSRSAVTGLLSFLFPSFYGPDRKYWPEEHYMRGPGPKWRAKHLADSASTDGTTLLSARGSTPNIAARRQSPP
jgi:hypothetical protein